MPNANPFPANLKAARVQAKLSQPEASQRLKVSLRSVKHWESGKLSPIYPAQVGSLVLLKQKAIKPTPTQK